MKSFLLALCLIGLVNGQTRGSEAQCNCGTPCLIGARLYWSHEGVNAVLNAWVQTSWTIGQGRTAPPEKLEMTCNGDITTAGVNEFGVSRDMEFSTYVIPGDFPIGQLDLNVDQTTTAIGDVERRWGQGVIKHVEVGVTQMECCISGESRYTPLENAEECAPYNICVQVDLRATNEGPKPIGSEENSGIIDRLFEYGFVLSSVCTNAVIDLEAVDESEDSGYEMFFNDPRKVGHTAMAQIDGVEPTVSADGFFAWSLSDVAEPDGIHSVNIVVQETEFAGVVPLRGTMDIDFLVAIDPTDPFCEFVDTSDLSIRVGETFTGVVLVEDRDLQTQFANIGDRIDVRMAPDSDPFDSDPPLPLNGERSPFEIAFSATCDSHGTKIVAFDLTDTCDHNFSCRLSYDCQNSCGDGIVSEDERCEPDLDDDCRADCTKCGDGIVDNRWDEYCDDGNRSNSDGCRRDCTACGDGLVQEEWNETCDPEARGSSNNNCRDDCTKCGDGFVDPGEACDDGNSIDTDSCRNDCALAFCGDGIVDPGEECDDGDEDNFDSCRNDCTLPYCGDGIKDRDEECDDGNRVNEDDCRNDCTLPFCGDGIVDEGELCDDGNRNNEDECDENCHVCPDLYYIPEKTFVCSISCDGDGIFQAGVHDLETFNADWFYPGTTWFDTEFDCWCNAVCEPPPDGHTFVCHYNGCEWILASPMTEPMIGPMNDLDDLLEAGAFPPGSVHDGQFFDCWCRAWNY